MNREVMIEQLKDWATKLAEGYDDVPIIAGMLDVATDLEREEEAEESLEVPDLAAFEPCGLYDDEIQHILDTDSLAQAHDLKGNDVARKDSETGDVWTLCWFRVRKGDEVACKLCRQPTPLVMAHRHGGDYVGDCCWDERLRTTE